MTAKEILSELKPLGSASIRKVLLNHGIREPVYGVKVSDLQVIRKRIKKDYQLALDLYGTGVYDAMYLAGLIADDARMTRKDLQHWVDGAYCRGLCGSTVAWVTAGSPFAWELSLKWIDSKSANEAACGWATLGSWVSITPDAQIDTKALEALLRRVEKSIHTAPDVVRYQMNGFVIAVGAYVLPLTPVAIQTGERIGPVTADLGDTECSIPFAPDYIRKIEARGSLGKKRKTAKC